MKHEGSDAPKGTVSAAFVIRGHVQGVGFRWATKRRADELGLAGAVWNRRDGAVEVRVMGRPETVRAFRGWLSEGPPAARVERVDEVESTAAGTGPEFGSGGFTIERSR